MADLDRAELLAALAKLADSDDTAAAAAGRVAAAMVADAGLDWSDIVVPESTIAALAPDPAPVAASTDAAAIGEATTNSDAIALIDRLLARANLYEGTREELVAYRKDIAEGTFDVDDLAYLNALYARVTSNKVRSGG